MPVESEAERYCVDCGYNLRGLGSDRCPECGLPIDTAMAWAIPWESRGRIGYVRAFWRTLIAATFGVKRLVRAASQPVDAKAAMRFRVLIAILVALPPSALFWIAVKLADGAGFLSVWDEQLVHSPLSSAWDIRLLWSAGATLRAVLPIGLFIAILMSSGAVEYWVRARNLSLARRARAATVGGYLFAPLSMIFFPGAICGALWQIKQDQWTVDTWSTLTAAMSIGSISVGVVAIACLVNSLRFISGVTHCGWGRIALAAIGLPICWAIALVVGLGIFPMLVGLVWIMIDSLRN
jgi:hypothetical protein